jgi:hypothetical protein
MLEYGRMSHGCKRRVEFFMSKARTSSLLLAAGIAGLLGAAAARATPGSQWMGEEAMRAAFIGKTLDGHYGNGVTWTESYLAGGRLDYREAQRQAGGNWHFRGHVFCTFYDPTPAIPPLSGGCWTAIKVGANCYEFYLANLAPEAPLDDDILGANRRWSARGWRQDEPSTCHDKPAV